MEICGNIYVAKDTKSFWLKCIYCEKEDVDWEDFVNHIESFHNDESEDETSLDPLEDISAEHEKQEEGMDEGMQVDDDGNLIFKEECLSNSDCTDNEGESDEEESDSGSIGEQKKLSTKFKPNFYKRCSHTLQFIELYSSWPCLWNPSDVNYRNYPLRSEAHKQIIESMKRKFRVTLTNRGLIASIKKLRKEYYTTLQLKKEPASKISTIALEYFEKSSFLSVFDNSPEDITNECDNMKYLVFGKLNEITLAFIDAYARFPALYDPKSTDYSNNTKRKQAYEDMISALKIEHNAIFTEEELYKGIHNLRQWYYKTRDRFKNGSGNQPTAVQHIYLGKCNFLPPKVAKKKLSCDLCGKISHNDKTLQVHMYKEHKVGELPHKCPNCERTFEMKSALLVHQQRSHLERGYQCQYCVRRFSVLVDLNRHIRTHTGERPFVCELCGKAFRSKVQLGYHTAAIHTKIRAFKCTMCPKDFLKRCDLTDHIKSHLNIRDKICETCGKGFTSCHSLIRHRQIHSEVKKFACKLCDAKFHQFVGLNAHSKRIHNIVKK